MKSFRNKVIQGISWNVVLQFAKQAINFIFMVILARMLSPHDFGLMGIVLALIAFPQFLGTFGLESALIQNKNLTDNHIDSVYSFNLIFGIIFFTAFILLAPYFSNIYDIKILEPMLKIISISFLLGPLFVIHKTLLIKLMKFKKIALIEMISVVISGVVAIVLALKGFGVWSLVAQNIIIYLISMIMYNVFSNWSPRYLFVWQSFKELFKFSSNLFGNSILNYFIRYTDKLIIGGYFGEHALGIYNRSYGISFRVNSLSKTISHVLFPSYSLIQDDKDRIKNIHIKSMSIIALIFFPVFILLLITSKSFVLVVFGEKWIEIIPFLKVFCILGIAQTIGMLNENIYLSLGRTDLQLKLNLITKVIIIISMVIGLTWGAFGVACLMTFSTYICLIPQLYFGGKLIQLSIRTIIKSIVFESSFCIIAALITMLFKIKFLFNFSILFILLTQIITFITIYIFLIHTFKLNSYINLKKILFK